MATRFCRHFCGQCDACREALADIETLDKVLASLDDADAASLHQRDPDDPRTFALDHKGRP